ncbi:hypothetical protein [Streptomyces broussonetiae]|uniref:Uncharacterized protein n=1 Tax=Streptomyces broussonetiae TaxID=2686304 RepID=A0A6I6NAG1_9ACTN|nr:hypothetical protein [Streptomyces broussonetiae]QHA06930.1 hypothetical protein GQF42_29785 [Streptomyces broussonetiae]
MSPRAGQGRKARADKGCCGAGCGSVWWWRANPALPWAVLPLPVGAVMLVEGADGADVRSTLWFFAFPVGGSALVGVLTGPVLAGGLSLAARASTGTRGLAVEGALLVALLHPVEILVVAVATGAGPVEFPVTVVLWPVMAVVAGVHSADAVGRSRGRRRLWAPAPAVRLRRR